MAAIVRWTTPIIVYKPSQVEVNDIEEIYVVLRQGGQVKIEKGIEEASRQRCFQFKRKHHKEQCF